MVLSVNKVVVALAVLALASPAAAAAGDTPRLVAAEPAHGALVAGGDVVVGVRASGLDLGSVRIAVDGAELDVTVQADAAGARVALAAGSHVADARAVDGAGREVRRLWRFETSARVVRRHAGSDRVGTAIALSQDRFGADRASAAVLVRADDFADALAGVPLAVAEGAPLLLTGSEGLDPAVGAELTRVLGAGAPVLLLGGEQALAAGVARDVAALGLRPGRIAGGSRYETAALVAAQLPPVAESATAVLASGATFPDALAASVPAAVAGWPVLLTERGALPDATAARLRDYDRVVLVGGEQAVDRSVEDQVGALRAVERVAGPTRYDTAAAINRRFAGVLDATGVALSSGTDFPDALAGGAHAAAGRRPLVLTGAALSAPTAAFLADQRPAELLAYGGPAALSEDVLAAAHAVVDDGGGPATVESSAGAELGVGIATDLPQVDAARSSVTLTVDGWEVDTVLRADGSTLRVDAGPLPGSATVHLVAAVRGPDLAPVRHVRATFPWHPVPALVRTPEGFDLVAGDGPVAGAGGPVRTYSLEVEPATGVDPAAFAAEAEAILSDARGWTARGERRLQRVGRADADLRVALATPATVDTYCARAGLDTGGRYSCWNGRFALLNVERWRTGSDAFAAPLDAYRSYLVSHEVGHGLGYGHVGCPAAGALAPVMMQQTISTGACRPNAWPYP